MSPRPGLVLEVDRSTPPTLFGTGSASARNSSRGRRVIYPPEPLPDSPIRRQPPTRSPPPGDSSPLPESCDGDEIHDRFDDVSLPLPQMEPPDVRQRVIEEVLDMAAAAGVDDVVLIVALALHRRMTEAECVTPSAVASTTLCPPGSSPSTMRRIPTTSFISARPMRAKRSRSTRGRSRVTCWSTSTSTSWRWTGVTSRSPAGWRATRASDTITTRDDAAQPVVHGHAPLGTPHVQLAHGSWIDDADVKVFQIETRSIPTRFPPSSVTSSVASGSGRSGQGRYPATRPRSNRTLPGWRARSSNRSFRRTVDLGHRGRG